MYTARCCIAAGLAVLMLGGAAWAQPAHMDDSPDQNTAPVAESGPNSLSGAPRVAIGKHFRSCEDSGANAEVFGNFSVLLIVVTDASGTVREAEVSPQNTGDMSNPLYLAFTQRALAAVLNAQCATLPLPKNMLGQNETFTFLFSP